MLYSICYKGLDFPHITCYIKSKWLYNLVCNICCQLEGPDYNRYIRFRNCYTDSEFMLYRVPIQVL